MSDSQQGLIGKRVNVLDQGWIELVDLMPHPASEVSGDLAIVNAARVSFLGESKGTTADKKLLFYLLRNAHASPFEMVELKFRVRCPLITSWQWVRHRTWNINGQSGRYTPFEEDDFYVPDVWRNGAAGACGAARGEHQDDTHGDTPQHHYQPCGPGRDQFRTTQLKNRILRKQRPSGRPRP